GNSGTTSGTSGTSSTSGSSGNTPSTTGATNKAASVANNLDNVGFRLSSTQPTTPLVDANTATVFTTAFQIKRSHAKYGNENYCWKQMKDADHCIQI
ncbi:hypothetical protein TI05_19250, partial [Achromatium sp. WMS3]